MARPAGSILEYTVQYDVLGQRCLSVFHYRVKTAGSSTNVQNEQFDFLQTMAGPGKMIDKIQPCIAGNVTIIGHVAQFIAADRYARTTDALSVAGGYTGNCTAPNVSGVMVKRCELAGRREIGSLHIPGMSQVSYAGGFVTDDWKTAADPLRDFLNDEITTALFSGVFTPVLYHKPPFPVNYSIILEADIQPEIRTMRRRTVGLGI